MNVNRYLHDLVLNKTGESASAMALGSGSAMLSYADVQHEISRMAAGLHALGVQRFDRVVVYLDKRIETITAFWGISRLGGIFVPANPVLKPPQIEHIIADSTARVLISSRSRIAALGDVLARSSLDFVISIDGFADHDDGNEAGKTAPRFLALDDLLASGRGLPAGPACDQDVAAIFYTSGSTGRPKGVVLSHRNLVAGAESVAQYLGNHQGDRILSLLPLSFDAGFSQLTTAFHAGAAVYLHNYLMARDVPALCARHSITGLTCVPPLWMQLLAANWTDEACSSLRYFANTGGRMPHDVLKQLRALFPQATPYLMYGLTEAFRSTYLDPLEVDKRPDSIGKAIPNAEILVVKGDGSLAKPGEEGELVHRGPLVALGYWNDSERTAQRFRPVPGQPEQIRVPELAVWSGDMVRMDEEGYLYFIGRTDEMIKTSGYRVSPTEVEEALFESGLVREVAAFGIPHEQLGQAIIAMIVPRDEADFALDDLVAFCRSLMPAYMVPQRFELNSALPRSPNGKIDRKALHARLLELSNQVTS
ncbi:acyl-CoA ligase (AMP-forming), exosortase A system-associated [Iodidimonas nitroreducens]|uniref:Acyl-CoA ligase (AMP-forming), exosortase A system-associated n=1 Tax=Iodidimonas nitroreducens TaxID=1236968 RepID=A0A5A7NAA9_9PROT|nr:acyl-CoA ligase (AMP-forming), exosortase A system-associated [Iodidimonas nitroreducens]GAK32252.1 long-chain-fatty-acid--CoA ligase [alpha proteobacterium Q-1]GER04857.1 acyl-CoA ligase (AMP-forming), exosortase A system-associated [Iodidimonas nitroreducens]